MTNLIFADSETLSLCPIEQGAYKYHRHPTTDNLVWGWVINQNANGGVWSPSWAWGNRYRPDGDPEELLDLVNDGAYLVAWNAAFDRHHWNEVMVKKYGWPKTKREQWLCAQAQAEGNNLPGKLEKAADAVGGYHKDKRGAYLIRTMCNNSRDSFDADRFETPEMMGHFRAYCLKDCLAMRSVWNYCRPLTMDEWTEYHASEEINDRGVEVDAEFARAAREYAEAEFYDLNQELFELTEDERITITNHVRKAKWLHDELWPSEELQQLTEKPAKEGEKARYSADRSTRELILDLITSDAYGTLFKPEHSARIVKFLEIIEAGNSAAVRKFAAIDQYEIDGRIHGAYSFNGAGQTGRYSSRGVQVHNLIRSPVDKDNSDRAIDAMDDIMRKASAEYLRAEYGFPVSRLLARLIRPTFIAPEGKTLVWGDWDQIEARVLPWLSNSADGELKLDLFRADLDVYKYAAAQIFGIYPDKIDDNQRQVGKVAELALGFGGGVGAFSAMGRGYGVTLSEAESQAIVDTWRSTNQWCVSFWFALWEAALNAYRSPGIWFQAGRVAYYFHPSLMRGTLICALPDGRWLVYPAFRYRNEQYEDDKGRTRTRKRASFKRAYGSTFIRVDLWHGTLAENVTQATAASFLRRSLVELRDVVVLHTHDEVVTEIDLDQAEFMALDLEDTMTFLPEWADGLPLSVTVETGPYYTK